MYASAPDRAESGAEYEHGVRWITPRRR
jgi:hypothetical protein